MGSAALVVDKSRGKGGTGVGFKPTELLLHALAACLATTVVQVLANQRLAVRGHQLQLHGERAAAVPARFTRIMVGRHFTGDQLKPDNLERIVALADDNYCSVSAMLPRGLVEHQVHVHAGITPEGGNSP
jgi:putative redox protein